MTTGERLRARRKEIGISADDVAKALGVSRATVFRYEKGDIEKLPGSMLEPLARVLHTTPAYLMGWEENETTSTSNASITLTAKDERDIAHDLENALSKLSDDSALMFDGEPLDDETRELLRISLENQFRMAKIIAKEKYTPKKYRKNKEG